MTAKPSNVIIRKDLTDYAFAIMPDVAAVNELANILAPVVPTGATVGRYNTFSDLNSFRTYASAQRAVGGQSNTISFLSDTGDFTAKPYGLRISIDQFERQQAGDGGQMLLEQGKTRTLTLACAKSRLANVVTTVKASISAAAGKGVWSNANVDPIVEIDEQIEAIWNASGMLPNYVVMDFGAWLKLKNNPLVTARMPGADLAVVNADRAGSLLSVPSIKLVVTDVAMYANRTNEAADTKSGALAGSCLIVYSSQAATQYDPSFCKTFSPSASLFTDVYSYDEQPHLTWLENNWTESVNVISTSLAKRIDVT